jgi:hypothetical protein
MLCLDGQRASEDGSNRVDSLVQEASPEPRVNLEVI